MDISSELSKAERQIAAGELEAAKATLRGVLAQDKRNADAWYLVAQSVADPKAKAEALRRTLLTDPDHPRAKREFKAMDGWAILKPPSMEKSATVPADASPSKALPKASVKEAPKRHLPLVPLLISGGVVLVVLVGVALVVASRASNTTATPTTLALVASARPSVQTAAQSSPTVQMVVPVNPNVPPTPVSAATDSQPPANDSVVLTATVLQQNIAATGTSLAQAAGNRTQVAALTQTATQQGALGATVAAQQTSMAALSALPGTLIVFADNTNHLAAPNVQFVSFAGMLKSQHRARWPPHCVWQDGCKQLICGKSRRFQRARGDGAAQWRRDRQ